MAQRAAAYQRDAAASTAASKLSSGQPLYQSCENESLFWSDDLVEHLSKMPLHVLLGIANNRINRLEADVIKLDEDWAMSAAPESDREAWREAQAAVIEKEVEIANIKEQITTHESAMLECKAQEPTRKEWDKGGIVGRLVDGTRASSQACVVVLQRSRAPRWQPKRCMSSTARMAASTGTLCTTTSCARLLRRLVRWS